MPTLVDAPRVSALASALILTNDVSDLMTPDDISRTICLDMSWGQLLPVCSIVGGFLSQEIVKAVSKVGVPMINVFVFSLLDGIGRTFSTSSVDATLRKKDGMAVILDGLDATPCSKRQRIYGVDLS